MIQFGGDKSVHTRIRTDLIGKRLSDKRMFGVKYSKEGPLKEKVGFLIP